MSEYCQPSARSKMSGVNPVEQLARHDAEHVEFRSSITGVLGTNVAALHTPRPTPPRKGEGRHPVPDQRKTRAGQGRRGFLDVTGPNFLERSLVDRIKFTEAVAWRSTHPYHIGDTLPCLWARLIDPLDLAADRAE
jgi:hypothetical protein